MAFFDLPPDAELGPEARLRPSRTEATMAITRGQSNQRARTVPYVLTAADAVVAVGANRETIGHLQQALDVGSVAQAGEVDGIRLELAGLHFVVGDR